MKISVITIVYNDRQGIAATIENVVGQSARDSIEYIVVDGASTDGTSEIVRSFGAAVDRYICEPDSGIYNAMNKGIDAATGDYIIFINSGDRFSSASVVEQLIAAIGEARPDVVWGHYRETFGGASSRVIPCRNADKIWYGPVASHQSTLYRLGHLRDHRLRYDESFRIAADYKLTAEAIRAAGSTLRTDICISDFDINGVSSTNQDLGLQEANRVRREVFGWGGLRINLLTAVLLGARFAKRYMSGLYKLLRY